MKKNSIIVANCEGGDCQVHLSWDKDSLSLLKKLGQKIVAVLLLLLCTESNHNNYSYEANRM